MRSRTTVLTAGLTALSFLAGAAGYALVKYLFWIVQKHPHLGVAIILVLLVWGLSTTLWILGDPKFRSDPKLPTEISDGHE